MEKRGKLLILVTVEAAAVIVLATRVRSAYPIRWHHLGQWMASSPSDAVVIETGRLAALVIAGWFALTTAAAFAARVVDARTGWSGWSLRVGAVTPVFVRHLVEGAVAVSVLASALSPAPASARDVAPLGPVRDGRAPVAVVTAEPPAPATVAAPSPAPAPALVAIPTVERTHTVQPGESLWSIAHDHAAASGTDVDQYWRRLCDLNRDTLASGRVDVIYPGETIAL